MTRPKTEVDLDKLLAGDRAALARAITLVESKRADHRAAARRLLEAAMPAAGRAVRVGITGVPGRRQVDADRRARRRTSRPRAHRVAVLAVDPSSTRSGGSILGDKTRMARLAADPNAFIRPSPTSGTLGGVAAKTRETMLLCEAAGLRRRAGRDRRRRPVRDGGRRPDRLLPGADAARRRRRAAGHQEGRARARRHDRRQQGRRRQRAARLSGRRRIPRRAAHPHPVLADLVAAGRDGLGAHRTRASMRCGERCSSIARG